MTKIHLVGSEGFIGRAIQAAGKEVDLHCWSHRHSDLRHHFDLLDSSSWHTLLSHRPSHIILLSWPGLPNYAGLFHITRNLPACIDFINQLVASGLQRLVLTGTCYEYGLQCGALSEIQLADPVNCYSIAKDCLRRTISSKFEAKLTWCWARIFYAYGAGQNPNSLLSSLDLAIQTGQESFEMSSGRQLRDFIHVHEVAKHLLTLAVHQDAAGVYNVGTGIPRSVLEMAEEKIRSYDSNIVLNKGVYPDRPDEPLAFWAQIEKLESLY